MIAAIRAGRFAAALGWAAVFGPAAALALTSCATPRRAGPAATASPPRANERATSDESPDTLVDLSRLDPSIRLDIRYATERNFTGTRVYPVARCLLRRDVAERLMRVQARLREEGLGLELWDCYRPISIQRRFWSLVPDSRYVAEPVFVDGRPVAGSKHNRGAAIDATLVDAAGKELEMPTGYDDFTSRAHRDCPDWSARTRANAGILEQAMVGEGFEPLATEWWHFDGPGWQHYPLSDAPLDGAP